MPVIHDRALCDSLHMRADRLSARSARQWGTMTVDQMLWHVNAGIELGLGRLPARPVKTPLPHFLMRAIALNMPWPKGKVPAIPETIATGSHDLEAERQRFHSLLEEFAAVPLTKEWLIHPSLGRLDGTGWSRLQAKHVDHHFRQFGV